VLPCLMNLRIQPATRIRPRMRLLAPAMSGSNHRESMEHSDLVGKDSPRASSCLAPDRVYSLSPLECALPDKLRVLSVFSRNRPPLSSLESTLARVPISVDCKELIEKLSLLDATLTKKRGQWDTLLKPSTFQPANIPTFPVGPIAGHSLWCHNPQRYEIGRQPRETNSSWPVSKDSKRTFFLVPAKRTSGTVRAGFQGLYLQTLSKTVPFASRAWRTVLMVRAF
jgi:hypothetical protein